MKQKESYTPYEFFKRSPRKSPQKLAMIGLKEKNHGQGPEQFNKIFERNKNLVTITTIQSPIRSILDLLEIYQWRSSTDYPVIRSNWKKVSFSHLTYGLKNKKQLLAFLAQNHSLKNAKIEVQTEVVNPLNSFLPLTITQYLYAFKESLIAFERLFSLFGSYSVSDKMITVNFQGKLRVWLSPNYDQNMKIGESDSKNTVQTESQILYQIKNIFAKYSQESITFRDFLKNIQSINTFIGLLKYLEQFSQMRKIIISKKIMKTPDCITKRPSSPIFNIKSINQPFKPNPSPTISSRPFNGSFRPSSFSPDLALISRASVNEKQDRLDTIQTCETLPSKNQNQKNQFCKDNTIGANYGKIVKNKLNIWLSNAKSMENLPKYEPNLSIQKRLEPNSIEKNINKLFDDDYCIQAIQKCRKYQSKLTKLGRDVRESISAQQ